MVYGEVIPETILNYEDTDKVIFDVIVKRDSGIEDVFKILTKRDKMKGLKRFVQVHNGQIQSRPYKGRMMVYVYANMLSWSDDELYFNRVMLDGYIVKDVITRRTPHKITIADLLIAYNERAYSHYIPSVAWWQMADYARRLKVKDVVSIEGRVQSRVYRKGEVDYQITELSICDINRMG